MRPRTANLVAWSLFGLFLAMVLTTLALAVFGPATADEGLSVMLVGYALAGTLIAVQRPDNAIGWLLIAIGLAFAFTNLVDAYVRVETAPGRVEAAWISTWLWFVWLTLAGVFLPLLFPNGRLLSPRWRPVLLLGTAALAFSMVGAAFSTGRLDVESRRDIENPLGVEGWAEAVVDALVVAGNVCAAVAFLLAASSLVVRFRRSRGRERQQLKLFAFAGLISAAGLLLAMIVVISGEDPDKRLLLVIGAIGWYTALFGIVVAVPVATAIAILRHRLYGIDVVIRRTLVYAALTGTLVASYLGGVLLLQLLLSPITADNGLAIAGSTLAAAALFRPARERIQAIVDRRFYRRRYDAAREVEAFGARLRDQVELEAVTGQLRGVVTDTMQPAHVSLWLREASR